MNGWRDSAEPHVPGYVTGVVGGVLSAPQLRSLGSCPLPWQASDRAQRSLIGVPVHPCTATAASLPF